MEKRIQLIQKRFNTETYKTRKSYLASNIKKLDEFINTTAATRRKNVKTRRNFAIEMRNKIRKEYESLPHENAEPVNDELRENLSPYDAIESINSWVSNFIQSNNIVQNETDIIDVIRKLNYTDDVLGVNNWEVIKTSGNINDCMVHTILTASSPIFRKLNAEDKNIVASAFRRTELTKIPGINIGVLKNNEFLRNEDLTLILQYYNISALIFLPKQPGRSIIELMNFAGAPPNRLTILIEYNGIDHYSSVRKDNRQFIIFLKNANTIAEKAPPPDDMVEGANILEYDAMSSDNVRREQLAAEAAAEAAEEAAAEAAAAETPAAEAPAPAAEELRSTTTDDIPVIIVEKQLALKDCQKRCKEISDDIRKLQSDNIMSEINLLGLSLDAKIVDLLVYRILDPSTEWKRNIEFLIDIPNDITGSLLKGGSYFEALFHLLFAINYYPKFQDNTLEFLQIEKYKVPLPFKADDGSRDYLYGQSILSAGGKSDIQGISDITFKVLPKNKSSDDTVDDSYKCGERPKKREDNINPHYFFSVKGFRKEKSVAKDYDIPILSQQASILQGIKNPKICVGVRDKDDFMRHLNRTKIVFIKETLSEIIIGFDEMMNYFDKFRQNFFLRFGKSDNIDERRRQVEELYPRNQIILPQLNLHYHQELVSEAVINSIKSKDLGVRKKPHFMCIGVLPRGGKSFIAGGVIRKHRELLKKKTGYNVLFLTSAVTETISQFKDDLVNKFADFRDITFVDARTDKPSINNFVFISRQLASISIKKGDEIVIDLFNTLIKKGINLSYDIIFFDEAHIGILSVIQQENFKKAFNNFKIPIVLMTATYIKPANVLDDNRDLFVWDLFDIKDMRQLPTNGADVFKTNTIASRYGDLAYKILSDRINVGESLASIAKPYEKFPMPSFVSPMFSKQTLAKLQYFDYDSFFKMKSLSLDEKNKLNDVRTWREWDAFLNNREQALMLRNYLTPKDNELANPSMIIQERDKALIQVFKRAYNNKPPTRPLYGQPFSVLMFMPSIKGNPVGALCRIWGSFLMKTKFWSDYFVCLTLSPLSEGDEDKGRKSKKSKEDMREYELGCWKQGFCTRDIVSEKDLKKMITTIEREALNEDKGLLLLTGEVAKMGISLPCVDVVFLLSNNNDSADDLIQKMFRSLTDSDGKKLGFVVDINLKRIIKAMFEYDLAKDKIRLSGQPKTTEERVKNILEMCDWGQDEFIEDNSSTMNYEDIMKAIKDKVFSNLELLTISTKVLQNEALSELLKDDDIRRELFNNMKKTVKVKTKATVLGVRGEGVPNKPPSSKDDNNEPAENTDEGVEEEDNHEPDEEEGVSNSISAKEKKHFEDNFKSLIITFINSLIVRNGRIEWKQGVRLMDLLDTFKIDSSKARPSVECACIDKSSCNEHMNLYERVFCDVKTYSLDKTADKVSALINAIYNFIMKHRELQVTLQSYIDTFIDEIEGNKQRPFLLGGGRKTLKKKRSPI